MHEAREGAEEGGEFRPAGPAAVLWAKGLLGWEMAWDENFSEAFCCLGERFGHFETYAIYNFTFSDWRLGIYLESLTSWAKASHGGRNQTAIAVASILFLQRNPIPYSTV